MRRQSSEVNERTRARWRRASRRSPDRRPARTSGRKSTRTERGPTSRSGTARSRRTAGVHESDWRDAVATTPAPPAKCAEATARDVWAGPLDRLGGRGARRYTGRSRAGRARHLAPRAGGGADRCTFPARRENREVTTDRPGFDKCSFGRAHHLDQRPLVWILEPEILHDVVEKMHEDRPSDLLRLENFEPIADHRQQILR